MVRRVANAIKWCGLPQLLAAMGLAAIAGVAPATAAAGPVAPALPPILIPEGATPLLRTHAAGTQTWIQRINTSGGVAPSTGCSQPSDTGAMALVPYSTDYVFLR